MAIINGRRVDPTNIPHNGVLGDELIDSARAGRGRRPIIEKGGKVEQIDPSHRYQKSELIDKLGRGAKISSMPDRTKGGQFSGLRNSKSFHTITEQVVDVAENLFRQGVDFDEEKGRWMKVHDYRLPENWHHIAETTSLMVAFPTEYPALPPVGFYMSDVIRQSPNGHLYDTAYHEAWKKPLKHGWQWYCVYIESGAWRPSVNWRHGDNLYTYFHLINEALASGE